MIDVSMSELDRAIKAPPRVSKKVRRDIPKEQKDIEDLISKIGTKAVDDEYGRRNDHVAYGRWSEMAHGEALKAIETTTLGVIAKELATRKNGEPYSEQTADYLARGGSLPALLTELVDYDEFQSSLGVVKTAADDELGEARRAYVKSALERRGFVKKPEKRELQKAAEERYTAAVLAKLRVITSTEPTQEESLKVGHLWQTIEKLSFGPDMNRTIEDLAGNHLHVIADLLLREANTRQKLIESLSFKKAKKVVHALKTNRLLRGAIAGAIFTASAASTGGEAFHIPQPVAEVTTAGLQYLAAYFATRELLEGSYEGVTGVMERRRSKKAKAELVGSKTLTDLTLRTAYNEVESRQPDRRGTDDPRENLKRFGSIDDDYIDLKTAPMLKEYKGEQMLEYCERLYLKKRAEIDRMLTSDDPEKAFYDLSSTLLTEDLSEMRDKLAVGKVRRGVFRGVSALASVLANQLTLATTGVIGDAKGLPKKAIPDLTPTPL